MASYVDSRERGGLGQSGWLRRVLLLAFVLGIVFLSSRLAFLFFFMVIFAMCVLVRGGVASGKGIEAFVHHLFVLRSLLMDGISSACGLSRRQLVHRVDSEKVWRNTKVMPSPLSNERHP